MTRLVRTVRPAGERFRLNVENIKVGDVIDVYIRLNGRGRPVVSFDMPPSVHLERE